MISDLDIWHAAQLLIKRYSNEAPIVADQRADELFESGDLDGVAVHTPRRRGTTEDKAQVG